MRFSTASLAIAAAGLGLAAHGAAFTTEDFNDGNAATRWTVTATDTTPGNSLADLAFDYSALSIPSAPNGSGTIGAAFQANLLNGVGMAINAISNDDITLTNYKVTYDVYLQGYTGGGSTEAFMGGFGANSASANPTVNTAGAVYDDGLGFAFTGEGGASNDVRVFTGDDGLGGVVGSDDYNAYGVYGVPSNWDLGGISGGFDAGPNTDVWHEMEVGLWDGNLYAAANGTLIWFEPVSVDLTGSVFIGQQDEFGSVNTTNISIFDNVVATELTSNPFPEFIPEPASAALLGLGVFAMGRRRR